MVILGASLAITLASGVPPVAAHNQVIDTTPEQGSVVETSPVLISIVTSGDLLDLGGNQSGFAIVTTDARGGYFGDGCVSVDGPALSSTVALGEPGPYLVTYQYVSEDGHTLSGQFEFDFQPAAGHEPAVAAVEPPICGEEPVVASAAEAEESEDPPAEALAEQPEDSSSTGSVEQPQSGGLSWLSAASVGGITIALIATMMYLWWLNRRRTRN